MKKILIFGFFLFTVMACKKPCEDPKPPKDYRDQWVGNYNFTTIDYVQRMDYDSSNSLISIHTYDTINFMGTIEKYETNRLKIIFKPNAIEPYNPNGGTRITQIKGLIYPLVDNLGNITYPDLEYVDRGGFGGRFTDHEITINYNQSYGHYRYETHNIQGIKTNKQ